MSGPAVGGIRVHLWQLMAGLPERGIEPLLAAPGNLPSPPGLERVDLPLGERLNPLRDLRQVRLLAAAHQQWRPDVVHAHGYKAAVVASVAGLQPLVVTLHNLWPAGAGRLARAGIRWALREARRQVCVSSAVLDSLPRGAADPSRAVVIPNAVDWRHYAELPDRLVARARLGLPAEAAVVGFAGRLTPVKGPQVLLEAVAELAPEFPSLVAALAGEGPARQELEDQAARLAITDRSRFLGMVPDIRVLFAAADVFAVPSLQEGGGILALEAMAAGMPLVASRVGGLAEVLESEVTGLLVPPEDPRELARGLRRLLLDADLGRRLGSAAAGAARQRPGAAEMVARVAEIYGEVLAAERRG